MSFFGHNHDDERDVDDGKNCDDHVFPPGKGLAIENSDEVHEEKTDSEGSGKSKLILTDGEFSHDVLVVSKFDERDESERKLDRLKNIEPVIENVKLLGAQESYSQSREDGNGSCQKDSLPNRKSKVQEALHHKLPSNYLGLLLAYQD